MRMACVVILAALAVIGCSSPERNKLNRGMEFAKKTIERANSDPAASASLKSSMEQGDTIADYVEKSKPENADLPPFSEETPTLPWSVCIRMTDQWHVNIEGYGEDLAKPLCVTTLRLSEVRR